MVRTPCGMLVGVVVASVSELDLSLNVGGELLNVILGDLGEVDILGEVSDLIDGDTLLLGEVAGELAHGASDVVGSGGLVELLLSTFDEHVSDVFGEADGLEDLLALTSLEAARTVAIEVFKSLSGLLLEATALILFRGLVTLLGLVALSELSLLGLVALRLGALRLLALGLVTLTLELGLKGFPALIVGKGAGELLLELSPALIVGLSAGHELSPALIVGLSAGRLELTLRLGALLAKLLGLLLVGKLLGLLLLAELLRLHLVGKLELLHHLGRIYR